MKTLSISIQDKTYQELKQFAGTRQISQFIDRLVAEELAKKKQRLIAGYKRVTKSKTRRAEDKIWGGAVGDGVR